MITNRMVDHETALLLEKLNKENRKLPRLTDSNGRKKAMVSSVEAYKKLKEYEDTGLTPEEAGKIKNILRGT